MVGCHDNDVVVPMVVVVRPRGHHVYYQKY